MTITVFVNKLEMHETQMAASLCFLKTRHTQPSALPINSVATAETEQTGGPDHVTEDVCHLTSDKKKDSGTGARQALGEPHRDLIAWGSSCRLHLVQYHNLLNNSVCNNLTTERRNT